MKKRFFHMTLQMLNLGYMNTLKQTIDWHNKTVLYDNKCQICRWIWKQTYFSWKTWRKNIFSCKNFILTVKIDAKTKHNNEISWFKGKFRTLNWSLSKIENHLKLLIKTKFKRYCNKLKFRNKKFSENKVK